MNMIRKSHAAYAAVVAILLSAGVAHAQQPVEYEDVANVALRVRGEDGVTKLVEFKQNGPAGWDIFVDGKRFRRPSVDEMRDLYWGARTVIEKLERVQGQAQAPLTDNGTFSVAVQRQNGEVREFRGKTAADFKAMAALVNPVLASQLHAQAPPAALPSGPFSATVEVTTDTDDGEVHVRLKDVVMAPNYGGSTSNGRPLVDARSTYEVSSEDPAFQVLKTLGGKTIRAEGELNPRHERVQVRAVLATPKAGTKFYVTPDAFGRPATAGNGGAIQVKVAGEGDSKGWVQAGLPGVDADAWTLAKNLSFDNTAFAPTAPGSMGAVVQQADTQGLLKAVERAQSQPR